MNQPIVKSQRIDVVDALRGFAVLAILLVVFATINAAFFPIGLHLAPVSGFTVSLLIGIAVAVLQINLCKWWLASHKQGPLERLWHKWTWLGKANR